MRLTEGRYAFSSRVTWLVFTLFSIVAVDYFVELSFKDMARTNPIWWLFGIYIQAPLYYGLSTFVFTLDSAWSWTFDNPFYPWIVIPSTFAYIFAISCLIAYPWFRGRTGSPRS